MCAHDNAVSAARCIPQARLITADTYGHLLLGSRQRIRGEIATISATRLGSPARRH